MPKRCIFSEQLFQKKKKKIRKFASDHHITLKETTFFFIFKSNVFTMFS